MFERENGVQNDERAGDSVAELAQGISAWTPVPSKKLSAAKPPDETVFFIDRSLGIEPIRTELVKAGLVFKITTTISLVMRRTASGFGRVGERGWVVLTKDQRLRYRPLKIAALRASKARVFVLTAGNLRGIEIATVFLAALPRIGEVLHSMPGPFVARVSQSGHVAIT